MGTDVTARSPETLFVNGQLYKNKYFSLNYTFKCVCNNLVECKNVLLYSDKKLKLTRPWHQFVLTAALRLIAAFNIF